MARARYVPFLVAAAGVVGVFLVLAGCVRTEQVTYEWIEDGSGWRQFYTTEMANYDTVFVWRHDLSFRDPVAATAVEAEVKKISGDEDAGYGVAFGLSADSSDYYCLLITVNREFAVAKVEDGVGTWLKGFDTSSLLFDGYEAVNRIRINHDSGSHSFSVYFNDVQEVSGSFVDAAYTSGYAGYVASVAPRIGHEFLPHIPVDVRCRMLQPEVDPP